jgi:hypothetical protein
MEKMHTIKAATTQQNKSQKPQPVSSHAYSGKLYNII